MGSEYEDFEPAAFWNEKSGRAIPFSAIPQDPASASASSAAIQSEIDSIYSNQIATYSATATSSGSGSISTSIGLDGTSTAALTGSVMTTTSTPTASVTSTFATSISTGNSTSYSGDPASATNSAHPFPERHHGGHLSSGVLAAAIVVPILTAIIIIVAAFIILRKRSREDREGGNTPFFPAMKQKLGSLRNSSNESREPVVMTQQNNAYFTGLDTSSHGASSPGGSGEYYATGRRSEGGTTFIDAPPPYKSNSQHRAQQRDIPHLNEPTGFGVPLNLDMSHLDTPTQPQSAHAHEPVLPVSSLQTHTPISPLETNFLGTTNLDPPQSSARSITSTLYSDTASLHSARAARMSVGPNVVPTYPQTHSRRGSDEDEGPFGDEANTPVTPLSVREQER